MYNSGCKKIVLDRIRGIVTRGKGAGAPGGRLQGAANGRQNKYFT